MARVVPIDHHGATVMNTARRRVVLLRVTSPNTLVSVVALPGSRYFITVVTFTHISRLVVTATQPQSLDAKGHVRIGAGDRPAEKNKSQK